MRLLIPLILLAASPAAAADQFDLACKGNKWTARGGSPEPTTVRLRVDVAAKKWCEGECKAALNMVAVEGDKLVFIDDSTVNTRAEFIRQVTYDGKTGFFIHNFSQIRPDEQILYIGATCTKEAFTPLP